MLHLNRTCILTKNPHLLKDFYTDTLGLKISYQDATHTNIELEAGKGFLLIQKVIQNPTTRIRIGFQSENMKQFRKELQDKNIAVTSIKVKEGVFSFELNDPDGNEIFVYE